MKYYYVFVPILMLFFSACATKPLEPISYKKVQRTISYENEIKPILDKRCVSCHSCYNSPCQLKLSSFEGLQRGSTKEEVYANRLSAAEPTRLFIDATKEEDWREKGFTSVLDSMNEFNSSSIMMNVLNQKKKYPRNIGYYSPETDEVVCARNEAELADFFEENPHKGMPYGFPALKEIEYNTLQTWLEQGAINDTKKFLPNQKEQEQIKKFEEFFNNPEIKYQVTSRYIYEHLFLAHISFDDSSSNFYELVRSKTPSGKEVEIIPTRFPFSEIKEQFYYRFRKIDSTIVHKTHMVYKLNDEKLARYEELFIKPRWDIKPFMPSFEHNIASNAYEQIPTKTRYQFLLDDIHYIIMTFIRGPVCKGQVALNVIQDHFWVMFLDPKYDIAVRDRYFLHDNIPNLFIPNEEGNNPGILKTLDVLRDYKLLQKYFANKAVKYGQYYSNGIPIEAIWKGNNKELNDSMLTIYRHFDSASVHKGALGNIPKTLWVIDYSLVERLYYSLVAGFDVFGNITHQLLVRKYMDGLRIEGEHAFLQFLPKDSRKSYFNEWYKGWDVEYEDIYYEKEQNSSFAFKTRNYKEEFTKAILKHTKQKKDSINFIEDGYEPTPLKNSYSSKQEIEESLKSLSLTGVSKITEHFSDNNTNLAYMRIIMENGENYVYSLVVNKWLENVAYMFDEEDRRHNVLDDIDFIEGFIGSYPNVFIEVHQKDLATFFDLISGYKSDENHNKKLWDFVINRSNPRFWEVFDWFDNTFKNHNKIDYGLFDINRYYPKAYYKEN